MCLPMLLPFILVLGSVQAFSSTYLATFPNSLYHGVPLAVRVHVLKASGPVSVSVNLEYGSNGTIVTTTSQTLQQGLPRTISLQVPADILPAKYVVSIAGSGGAVFRNHSSIEYVNNTTLLYTQTDKVRYSAGQTVRYRVVGLLPNLKAFTGSVSIDIYDGKDNRVDIIGPIQSPNGIVNGSVNLSTEPVFGTWKIVASVRDKTLNKTFDVNSYVLPKFTVDIELPDTVMTSNSSFEVRVKSRFTFNTDVHGNCTLQIYMQGYENNILEYKHQIDGAATFTVPMTDVRKLSNYPDKLTIRAIVTDNATMISMAAEKELVFFKQQNTYQPSVSITRIDSRDTFVPGIPYRTFLFVGRGDEPLGSSGNLTVSGKITTARVESCHGYYDWLNKQTVQLPAVVIRYDDLGYALLDIPNVPEYAQEMDLRVTYDSYTDINLQLYSVSNSPMTMLRLTTNDPVTKVGNDVILDIQLTKPTSGLISVEAYGRGNDVYEASVQIQSATTSTFPLTITPDMVPQVYIIVSHTTPDGVIIADYLLLQVDGEPFNTKINVSFSKPLLKPGEPIQITMTGTPNSSVYMLVQDQRNRIMGTDNDMFLYEVQTDVESFDITRDDNINNYPDKSGQTVIFGRKRSSSSLYSYENVYRDSGVIYLSDAALFHRTNKTDLAMYQTQMATICTTTTTTTTTTPVPDHSMGPIPAPGFTYAPWVPGMVPTPAAGFTYAPNKIPTPAPGQTFAPGMYPSMVTTPGITPTLQGVVTRRRFPETWIWDTFDIGSSGSLTVNMTVPDSITSWVTSSFAMNADTGFGIDGTKEKITVKKSFFVSMDLPETIILGEEFLLQVTVFNYLPSSQMVFIQVVRSDDQNNPIPSSATINPGQGYSSYIPVTPKAIGTLKITVMAKAGFFNTLAVDSLEKQVVVIPPGARITRNEQHLIHLSSVSPIFTKTVVMTNDPHMVNGTRHTQMSLTGNFMIPSIDGLQNLISLPYGCGEQTMLNFAPDIYITKYLKSSGKLTNDVKKQSDSYLQSGLQRELSYQHTDGSFSAFGDRDNSGSTWLTAFVLKCFQQARGLIKIDETISRKALTWLIKFQRQDGSFYEPGRIIHTQMQAGTSSGMKLTAFILASVLENKDLLGSGGSQSISKAKNYMESRLNHINDVYTLALVCYTLSKAGSTRIPSCLTMIGNTAIRDGETTHWEANTNVVHSGGKRTLTTRAPSRDIEATSYILLTYLAAGKSDEGFPIVRWLVSQRNPRGGFQSTQDTVISLQALAEYSTLHTAGDPSSLVNFNMLDFTTGFRHTYAVSAGNIDVVHDIEIPNDAQNIVVQAQGSGTAVFDVVTSYHVTAMQSGVTIDVSAPITHESLNQVDIQPCISWSDSSQSGQLLMEVEMPTGFAADSESLKSDGRVKKHEINGKKLVLYFDGVGPHGKVCVDVKMTRSDPVVKSQACHVIVYDYYNPINQAMSRYESGILKRSTICNVCPHCNFCTGNVQSVIVG